jgi:hypothetical protein
MNFSAGSLFTSKHLQQATVIKKPVNYLLQHGVLKKFAEIFRCIPLLPRCICRIRRYASALKMA